MSVRRDPPEVWAELVEAAREIVGPEWSEDQIEAVAKGCTCPRTAIITSREIDEGSTP